uniref:NADH-ubiquinone oxidoreductase chain 6 n=1 Tax=Dryadomorpha sp. EMHAU-2015-Zz060407 TaxID=2037761 RepID=A0A343K1Y5_9HEMI|nr:NADH dehydrogenase subunit 6 [Dryadomorpha sp. EMHAU-2015-Zz060407]
MKTLLLKIMISISSISIFLKNPMSLGIMLFTQTFLSTMLMAKILSSSWMPMIMFLMLIGGLLILFMYMSSIASNEKFKTTSKMFLILIMLMLPIEEFTLDTQMKENMMFFSKEMISMNKMFSKKVIIITMFLFCYLILTMIVVTKIVKIFKGPLRSS